MQKIKYPVGSKLKVKGTREENDMEIEILDISKNEYAALIVVVKEKDHVAYFEKWMTQEQLDEQGYKLVSTPRWIPEKGQKYWAIEALMEEIGMFEKIFTNNIVDKYFLKTDNMFRTLEECQKKIEEINSREI